MDFSEKLQELRKSKGLTQEELAKELYVSRTAVSKWESGRGYPSIDSLKDISKFFSVPIDDLLSGEKLISIADKENKSNIRGICDLIFGIADIFSCMLIALPLYPNEVDGFIYSVNLTEYTQTSQLKIIVYWVSFVLLILSGVARLILMKLKTEKVSSFLFGFSLAVNIFSVLFLGLSREAYAVAVAFSLLMIKVAVLLKRAKT
jgi:transcriptional regulator with XRE-family HTH domain